MREIEFRGKYHLIETDERIWIYGCNDWGEIVDKNDSHWRVDESTIGQWTGLLDKGFHRIYEGDVVKAEFEYGHKEIVGVVHYYTEWACYGVLDEHGEGQSWAHLIGLCTIIGNIFDDEELKKKYWEVYSK